ncbi:MAG: glycosyltransferase [Planctomycetes bacterium]|nr:glycosyltransferase [Planctomycetota bacterium]
MTKPWIVHVITKLELGGAQQNTLDTCARLDRSRFRVALLTGPDGALDSAAARIPDLDFRIVPDLVREVSPLRDLRAWRTLRGHVRSFAEDGAPVLVHTHSSKAGILGRLAARSAHATRVVHTVHGFGHPAFGSALARRAALAAERHVAPMTDAFVVVAQANADEGRVLGLFADKPVELIRSGFDVNAFREPGITRDEARAALGLSPTAPVVGVVACFKPQKAVADFLTAFAHVRSHVKDAVAIVVGDGELRTPLERLRAHLGLDAVVSFVGWRDDVPRILRALDAFVLTSRWEGLPRAVVQAMAAHVPVVATAADGTADVVKDGVTGVLCPIGDVDAIAAGIVRVLQARSFASYLAHNAASKVDEFDVARMIERLEALYDRLLRA